MGYLITGMIASAAVTLILKLAETGRGNRYAVLLGNYLTCIAASALQINGRHVSADRFTVLCGLAAGVLFVAGLVMMQRSISANGASLTGAFAKLGMLVPLMLGIILFHEMPGISGMIGIVLSVFAIILIHRPDDEKHTAVQTPLLLGTLAGCGLSDAMAKIFQGYGDPANEPLYFLILFSAAACLTAVLCIREYRITHRGITGRDLLYGVLIGIPNFYSAFLLLNALRTLPAVVVYPAYSVGSLLLILAGGRVFFHEPLRRNELAGIVLIVISLVFLNV